MRTRRTGLLRQEVSRRGQAFGAVDQRRLSPHPSGCPHTPGVQREELGVQPGL